LVAERSTGVPSPPSTRAPTPRPPAQSPKSNGVAGFRISRARRYWARAQLTASCWGCVLSSVGQAQPDQGPAGRSSGGKHNHTRPEAVRRFTSRQVPDCLRCTTEERTHPRPDHPEPQPGTQTTPPTHRSRSLRGSGPPEAQLTLTFKNPTHQQTKTANPTRNKRPDQASRTTQEDECRRQKGEGLGVRRPRNEGKTQDRSE